MLVKQKVELLELVLGLETNNKYEVKNSMGQDIYKAEEKSNFCARQCCGPLRAFDLEITDNNGREVMGGSFKKGCKVFVLKIFKF